MFKSRSATVLHDFKPKTYPTDASQYELLEECGSGVTSTVHRARCLPLGEVVAIKRCNLDLSDADLQVVIEEVAIMRRYQHPAVLPLLCSFVSESELWLVMPYMEGGSVAHVMRYAHTEGLEEPVIATIAKEVLRALEYLHKQGAIHRDVKAGNVLIAGDGTVRLGDFGVSATMERAGSWGHDLLRRRTLVGTPCWMAPEVMEESAYNDRADIWSFGITLLEMAHGSAPFAKLPPLKVLMMTLQNPPPQLEDRVGQRTFSKSMREVVAMCLQKEPLQRPSAKQLLEHRFFRQHARDKTYIVKHLLAGLPPLTERVRQLRAGFGGRVPTQQAHNREMRSRVSYMSGVLNWDFHLPAAHTAGQDSSCGGSTLSPTSANSGKQSPPTSHTAAGRRNAIQAAPTAPPPPRAPSPPLTSPSAQGIASSSEQPPLEASTPVSQPYLATNSPSAVSAVPVVPAAAPRSLVTLMRSSPPQILVEQHVPHAPEMAGPLVKSAASDAPKNASAATPAATDGGSAAETGVPGAEGSAPDGASAAVAAAGLTAEHPFQRASLRGSVSLPDLKQQQDCQTRPSDLTAQRGPQQPEQQAAQMQGPLAVTEGTLRGRSGATEGGRGGRGGGGGLRVSFAPDVLDGGRAGAAATAASPGGVVLRKGRFQVYESILPVVRPATAPLPSAVKKPATATVPPSTPTASSQPQSAPLTSAAAILARPEDKVCGPAMSLKPLQASSGELTSTSTASSSAASPSSAPPARQVRRALEPATVLCALKVHLQSPVGRFAESYSKWCDMALRSLLTDVFDAESALQVALVLMAAPPPQYVPKLHATELLLDPAVAKGSAATPVAQSAALPVLEHPVPRRGTIAPTEPLVPKFSLPPPAPPPPPPPSGMLLQHHISPASEPDDGMDSGQVTLASRKGIMAQLPQPPAPRPRTPSAPRWLLVPTLYPPLGLDGDDLSESDVESSSDDVGIVGDRSVSNAGIGGGASIGSGCGGKLVVVEVDERHPQYVGLAEMYGDRRGAGWASSAGLLQPLLQAMPREVEREAREVPLPALASAPAPAPSAPAPSVSGPGRGAGGGEPEHQGMTEICFRSAEGPDLKRVGRRHHNDLDHGPHGANVNIGVGVGSNGGGCGTHCSDISDSTTTPPESNKLVSAPMMRGDARQLQWSPPTPPHAPRLPPNRGSNHVATQAKWPTIGPFIRQNSPSGLLKAEQNGSTDSSSDGRRSGASSYGRRNAAHGGCIGGSNGKTQNGRDSTGSSDEESSSDVDRAIASLLTHVHVSPVKQGGIGRDAPLNFGNTGRTAAAPATAEPHPRPEAVLHAAVASDAVGAPAPADGPPSCPASGSPTSPALQPADVASVAAGACPMGRMDGAGASGINSSTAWKSAILLTTGNGVAGDGSADAPRTAPMLVVASEAVASSGPAVGGAVPPEVRQQPPPGMQSAFNPSSCQASGASSFTRVPSAAGRGIARGRFIVLSERA